VVALSAMELLFLPNGDRGLGSDVGDFLPSRVRLYWPLVKDGAGVLGLEQVTCLRCQKDAPWLQERT
jgi:hypothetical protein